MKFLALLVIISAWNTGCKCSATSRGNNDYKSLGTSQSMRINGSGIYWNGRQMEGEKEEGTYSGGDWEQVIHYHIHEVFDDATQCKAENEACTVSKDCCTINEPENPFIKLRCRGKPKTCQKRLAKCVATYGSCRYTFQCCFKALTKKTQRDECRYGICQPCVSVKARNNTCKLSTDCCSGFCLRNFVGGVVSGRCKDQKCRDKGYPCGGLNVLPCCEGTKCLGNVCVECGRDGEKCPKSGLCCNPLTHACKKGVCKKTCADVGKNGANGESCVAGSSARPEFPCCHDEHRCRRAIEGGPQTCEECVVNGGKCIDASDCCWKGSKCHNRRCKGCLENGYVERRQGCKTDSDCCNKNAKCGTDENDGLFGHCLNTSNMNCNGNGDGCYFTRKCCKGLTCQAGGSLGGGAGYSCSYPTGK